MGKWEQIKGDRPILERIRLRGRRFHNKDTPNSVSLCYPLRIKVGPNFNSVSQEIEGLRLVTSTRKCLIECR